ncbi:uncharacterized protein PFL1_06465 [Pseudozyma flocculosa PF-1]|uniref:DDE-1 domain-containing protein n=1 Tax=Pseudozyma flocculosa PF-1 TaxID=1277687 RepID=A0A061H621_9BASI|nr:uncharacterized protein PFL1_06465 [Pseudozyma flocculosa PF-1]EPQ26011.1 hypothetical protein PFL1_06465 [Pseudozyma flocculosa PF-1]
MPRSSSGPSPRQKAARKTAAVQRRELDAKLAAAVADLEAGCFPSLKACAEAHGVASSTLHDRHRGRLPHSKAHTGRQRLSPASEAVLARHVERCAQLGFPLTPDAVRRLAEKLMIEEPDSQCRSLGANWIQASFLPRHLDLEAQYRRCIDYGRIGRPNANNLEWVTAFFDLYRTAIKDHGIKRGNVYCMGETGTVLGRGKEQRRIHASRRAHRFLRLPGKRDSTSVVECIGDDGTMLPPLIIVEGKLHLDAKQRKSFGAAAGWTFGVSSTGWSSVDAALLWLEKVFDPATKPPKGRSGDWRLLLVDGHAIYTSIEFVSACLDRRIVPVSFPLQTTHVIDPLDWFIFGPISDRYHRAIDGLELEHGGAGAGGGAGGGGGGEAVTSKMDKATFARIYREARTVVSAEDVRRAFIECGVSLPPEPDKILTRAPAHRNHSSISTPPPGAVPPRDIATPKTSAEFRDMLAMLSAVVRGGHGGEGSSGGDNEAQAALLRQKLLKSYVDLVESSAAREQAAGSDSDVSEHEADTPTDDEDEDEDRDMTPAPSNRREAGGTVAMAQQGGLDGRDQSRQFRGAEQIYSSHPQAQAQPQPHPPDHETTTTPIYHPTTTTNPFIEMTTGHTSTGPHPLRQYQHHHHHHHQQQQQQQQQQHSDIVMGSACQTLGPTRTSTSTSTSTLASSYDMSTPLVFSDAYGGRFF